MTVLQQATDTAMLEAVLATLGVCSLLWLTSCWMWIRWRFRKLIDAASNLPVILPKVPLLGHAYLAICGVEDLSLYVWKKSIEAVEEGVKTFCIWIGPVPFIFIQDIDDIQILLSGTQCLDKPDEYDLLTLGMDSGTAAGAFGKSILSAGGARWRVTRKHMNPMFHPRNVQQLEPVFNANSRELVERMSHHLGNGPFDVFEYTMDLGLKTICNLIFGPAISIDVNSEDFKGLKTVVETIPELFILRLSRPWLRSDFIFRLLYRKKVKKMSRLWRNFTSISLKASQELQKQKIPRENIFYVNELNGSQSTEENGEPINFLEVFAALQRACPDFSDADQLWEIIILYATGSDSVGTLISSCLLALAQYQDIQDRLYREITSVVGPDDDVTLEVLSKMPYLEMVIKETLRRFVTVPFIARKPNKDVTFGDFKLPAGNPIVCVLGGPHMDPKIYPDPTKFDPERFSPENSTGMRKYAFIPFSAGPRMCIAKTYAMQLAKTALVHVLRKYKVTTTQDIQNLKMKLVVTLVCVEGYNVTLERRNLDQ